MTQVFDTPITTNDQSVDRVLAVNLPVVLVFTHSPVPAAFDQAVQRLARENAGQVLVAWVIVKDNPRTVHRYQLQRFPAVVTVREGQVLAKAEAILDYELEKHTAFLLGKGPRPGSPPPAASGTPESRPLEVTDASFEQEVLRSSMPVLVDFWAPGCGPCRAMEPILEKLARDISSRMRVVKVNASQNPYTAQRYGIQGVPTMLVVKGGQVVDHWVGALPDATLRQRLGPWLS